MVSGRDILPETAAAKLPRMESWNGCVCSMRSTNSRLEERMPGPATYRGRSLKSVQIVSFARCFLQEKFDRLGICQKKGRVQEPRNHPVPERFLFRGKGFWRQPAETQGTKPSAVFLPDMLLDSFDHIPFPQGLESVKRCSVLPCGILRLEQRPILLSLLHDVTALSS